MSTIRTTRAGSRAASSVGGAHAVGPEDIPVSRTPGRGRPRKAAGSVAGSERGTGLPPMAASTSTSYGTNTLALPNYGPRSAPLANDISSVIERLLEPEPLYKGTRLRQDSQAAEPVPDVDAPAVRPILGAPAHTPSMRSRSGPVKRRVAAPQSVDRNFQNESQLFDNASIVSTSYQQDDSLGFSGPSLDGGEQNRRVALRDIIEEQQSIRGGAEDGTFLDLGEGTTFDFREFLISPLHFFQKLAKGFFGLLGKPTESSLLLFACGLIAFIIVATFITLFISWIVYLNSGGPGLHWYGSDVSANIAQFLPTGIRQPFQAFAPSELRPLLRRLDTAESDIKLLKYNSKIHENAIAEIKRILPNFVALDKDKYGKPILPANLWQAMREKIRADTSLIPTSSPAGPPPSDSKPPPSDSKPPPSDSKSDTRNHEVYNSKDFDRYLESNKIKIQQWAGSEFDVLHQARLQQLIKDGKIASKDDVIELIKKRWAESPGEISSELRKLTKDLEERVANLGKKALTAEQVKALAQDVVRAQIEAISQANVDNKADQPIRQMDYFAKRSHSAIIPRLTSPSYRFPHMDVNFIHRSLAYWANHPVPLPNPAHAALTPWEDIGDCWCSPQHNGNGPTLGILTSYSVWPEEVVVEHFPQSGYAKTGISPLAVPKQMELLAFIPDKPTYLRVSTLANETFDEDKHEGLGFGWIKLAEWTYDIDGPINQAFHVQVNLKDFSMEKPANITKDPSATNKFIIRSKSNYGKGAVPYTCLYRVKLHGEVDPAEHM
ncbi:hypothetical protein NHQ30_002461 [Ciborinia camelliae]|nr:hypothetical protein NHQ30_002461 [Ciborinia camelliae]